MNLRERKTPGASLQHKGWMARNFSPLPSVEAEVFFLTSPFIERGYRTSWFSPVQVVGLGRVRSVGAGRTVCVSTCSRAIFLQLVTHCACAQTL